MSLSAPALSNPALSQSALFFRSLIAFVLFGVSVVSNIYIILPNSAALAASYGRTVEDVQLFNTAFSMGYAVGFLIWGPLSDTLGRIRTILLGALLSGAVTLILPQVLNSFPAFAAIRVLQGLSAAAFAPAALSWVAANIAEDRRFIATSWITTSFLLAGVIGQWIGGALGVSGALYALGGAYLVLGGIIATFPEVPVTVRRSFAENLAQMPGLIVATRSGPYFAATLVALGVFVALYTSLNIRSVVTRDELEHLRWVAIVAMIASVFAGFRLRLAPTPVLAPILAVEGVALALHLVLPEIPVWAGWAVHFGFTLALALSFPVIVSCIALTVDPNIRGTAMAAYTFTLFVGVSLGAWLAARLDFADLTLGYVLAFFACAILTGSAVLERRAPV
jgi:YNFM family putative membrane transporter